MILKSMLITQIQLSSFPKGRSFITPLFKGGWKGVDRTDHDLDFGLHDLMYSSFSPDRWNLSGSITKAGGFSLS